MRFSPLDHQSFFMIWGHARLYRHAKEPEAVQEDSIIQSMESRLLLAAPNISIHLSNESPLMVIAVIHCSYLILYSIGLWRCLFGTNSKLPACTASAPTWSFQANLWSIQQSDVDRGWRSGLTFYISSVITASQPQKIAHWYEVEKAWWARSISFLSLIC